MSSFVFLAAALLAQVHSDARDLAPYVLQLRGESAVRHVLVNPSQMGGIAFDVLIDEPWAGEQWLQVQRVKVVIFEPEESSLRKRWIENGWREHGGTQVPTRNGLTWVLAEDKEWADKSQALVQAAYASEEIVAEPAAPPGEQRQSGPGFLRLWGPHAAVLAAALALAAGVCFALLRPRGQWSALDSGNQAPRRR